MADYEIFREQLAVKYPSYGHALWGPSPRNPERPVQVGDVGFIRRGNFHRLFNALLPADDPSHDRGVPEYHEPLIPNLSDHLHTDSLDRNNYCSTGVSVEPDPGYNARPDDFPQVSFQCKRTRGGAVLSLPVAARREDTLAQGAFMRWIVKHIDSWFAFARRLELGIEHMEEIVLVTGCDRTRSWTNVAFLENQVDAQVSFGVRVEGPNASINFQFSPENARGAVLRHGPEGANLPENQCVFIRGFRASRSFWILPRRLKAAAGPSSDPGGYDRDPDTEVMSISANTKHRDLLHVLLDYIAEQAPDCDMMLTHDDNLATINGIGQGTFLGTLEPDVMMALLQRSNIEIHKVLYDLSPSNSPSGLSTGIANVKVAMLPVTFQNWNSASPPQGSPIAAQNIDLPDIGDSQGTPLQGSLRVPTIRGDKNKTPISDYPKVLRNAVVAVANQPWLSQMKQGDRLLDEARDISNKLGPESPIEGVDFRIFAEKIICARDMRRSLEEREQMSILRFLQAQKYRRAARDAYRYAKRASDLALRTLPQNQSSQLIVGDYETVERIFGNSYTSPLILEDYETTSSV